MANTVKVKRSAVAGKVPVVTDLQLGELAINTNDGKLFLKKSVAGVESIVDVTAAGGATVTSVGLSMPSIFTVSGSPVTTSGTLTAALASQTANQFLAAPNGSNGVPSFRAIALADIAGLVDPVVTVYASGSGTYTTPAGAKLLLVEMVGAGGGGGGSGGGGGAGNGGAGTNGGNTTFAGMIAGGGVAGNGSNWQVGTGGTYNMNGYPGLGSNGVIGPAMKDYNAALGPYSAGSIGHGTPLGTYGQGGVGAGPGAVTICGGSAGGSGAFIFAYLTNPNASYTYAVGAAGSGGAAGTYGQTGGAGGSGAIIVTAFF